MESPDQIVGRAAGSAVPEAGVVAVSSAALLVRGAGRRA
jgi:hypothetical protein